MNTRPTFPWATLVAVFSLAAVLTACRGATTLYNPPPASFTARSITDVENAILKALATRQWIGQKEGPGSILGTLNIREHQAVVRIAYTETSYRIGFVASRNLDYAQSGGVAVIHSNYNGWVKFLSRDIDTALGMPMRQL